MPQSKGAPSTLVGLESRFPVTRRAKRIISDTSRPHWSNITLNTEVYYGQVLGHTYSQTAINNLSHLYATFRKHCNLDQFKYTSLNDLPRAENEIINHILKHFTAQGAFGIEYFTGEYKQKEGYVVLYPMKQPFEKEHFSMHCQYLNDTKHPDPLIRDILHYGYHYMCWQICFESWHGFLANTEMLEEHIYSKEADLESYLKRVEEKQTAMDEDYVNNEREEIEGMRQELDEYSKLSFDRKDGIKIEDYKELLARIDKKRFAKLHSWASLIVWMVENKLCLPDFVPYVEDDNPMSPVQRYYLMLKPGYMADNYEESFNIHAQEAMVNLCYLDYYYDDGRYTIAPRVEWGKIIEKLFKFDMKKVPRIKAKPLMDILLNDKEETSCLSIL